MHSGTANSGHYWSYINTNRGEQSQQDNLLNTATDKDPWMEFNDDRVTNWNFNQQ